VYFQLQKSLLRICCFKIAFANFRTACLTARWSALSDRVRLTFCRLFGRSTTVCCCCTICDMEMFKFWCRSCEFLPSPPVAYFQRGKSLLRFYAPWTQSATAFCQQHTVPSQGGFYVMLHPCIRLSRPTYLLVCLLINMLCGRLGKCCNGHSHSIYCVHDVAKTSCTTYYVCASYINVHGNVVSF
jgi:hypothetical protein